MWYLAEASALRNVTAGEQFAILGSKDHNRVMEPAPDSLDEERARIARLERAERILGGLLPGSGEDTAALDWGEDRGNTSRDDELRRDVPPHHGKD